MDVAIVRLTPANAGLLDTVAAEVFDAPVRPDRLAACLAAPGHFLFVAVAGGTVVGQCAARLQRHPDKPADLYIDEIAVTPAHRRRGIGRRLTDAALALGAELGCAQAWVGTELDDAAARRLQESRGAQPVPFVLYLHDLRKG